MATTGDSISACSEILSESFPKTEELVAAGPPCLDIAQQFATLESIFVGHRDVPAALCLTLVCYTCYGQATKHDARNLQCGTTTPYNTRPRPHQNTAVLPSVKRISVMHVTWTCFKDLMMCSTMYAEAYSIETNIAPTCTLQWCTLAIQVKSSHRDLSCGIHRMMRKRKPGIY